jgi:hypothetical protein
LKHVRPTEGGGTGPGQDGVRFLVKSELMTRHLEAPDRYPAAAETIPDGP